MKRKLREELRMLATDIITSRDDQELSGLYEKARSLFEKIAVLKFIEENLQDIQVDVSKSDVASRFESIAGAVLNENREIPENNPHEEDIITPGIDTIKHMVSEMPGGVELEDVLKKLAGSTEFMKSEKDIVTPVLTPEKPLKEENGTKSLNDKLTDKMIQVGLNDRLAFVKNLFEDNTEAFNAAIAQLNTIDTEERSIAYIQQMVKPEYGNWEGKEDYEARFMSLITRRFA